MNKVNKGIGGLICAAALGIAASSQAAWKSDPLFGTAGLVRATATGGSQEALVASAVDAQGRIVAVGTYEYAGKRDLLVVRTSAAGTPDLGFGFGGRVTIDAGSDQDSAVTVAVQADGRIVVGGARGAGALLARLNSDGALDTSFGTGGFLTPSFLSGSGPRVHDLAIDAQGRAVALGSIVIGGAQPTVNAFVLRAQPDGTLDRAFDNDGVRILREFEVMPAALSLDAAGRIVIVGHWHDEYRLAALTVSGTLDLGFGGGGLSRVVVGPGAIATDLLAHGGALYISGLNGAPLLKLDPAGAIDAGFGTRGFARVTQSIDAWTLGTLADGTLGIGGSCRGAGGDSWMFATLSGADITVAACGPQQAPLATVRGLASRAGTVVAIGHEFGAAGAQAATLRYVWEPAVVAASPVRFDKRCKKAKFRKRNPALCAK